MTKRTWRADAPSNIALIKYMGKQEATTNQPMNSSLSMTLPHLRSFVELELTDRNYDLWEPMYLKGRPPYQLSEVGEKKFLKHLQFLKDMFLYEGHFLVRSANDFPSDCGLASSASSFAALTRCAVKALCELTAERRGSQTKIRSEDLARWSQQGSGSSCRSFFEPFAIWSKDAVRAIEFSMGPLLHQVVVASSDKKRISSSEAHRLVIGSLLFSGRVERAERRLNDLCLAMQNQNWKKVFHLVWSEFWDMHALFETSAEPFGYMSSDSMEILNHVREHWFEKSDGPLVTMDAGANVHLIYREEQISLARKIATEFSARFTVISSFDLETLK